MIVNVSTEEVKEAAKTINNYCASKECKEGDCIFFKDGYCWLYGMPHVLECDHEVID